MNMMKMVVIHIFCRRIKLLDRSCFTVEYGQLGGRGGGCPTLPGPSTEKEICQRKGKFVGLLVETGKVNMCVCVWVCV